eukprot:3010875-Prymnesium_polylepis.1
MLRVWPYSAPSHRSKGLEYAHRRAGNDKECQTERERQDTPQPNKSCFTNVLLRATSSGSALQRQDLPADQATSRNQHEKNGPTTTKQQTRPVITHASRWNKDVLELRWQLHERQPSVVLLQAGWRDHIEDTRHRSDALVCRAQTHSRPLTAHRVQMALSTAFDYKRHTKADKRLELASNSRLAPDHPGSLGPHRQHVSCTRVA